MIIGSIHFLLTIANNHIHYMNHKTENRLGKQTHRMLKSAVAAPLKKMGVPSPIRKEASAIMVDNALGIKKSASSTHSEAKTSTGVRTSITINSGGVIAGHGIQGKATLNTNPLQFQAKETIRRMSAPSASLEVSLPIMSDDKLKINASGQYRIEQNRKPESRFSVEAKSTF